MSIKIYAVGDIMLGEQSLCYNFGVKSVIKNKGIDYLFKDVKDIFKNGDIVFGNLEAPISNYTDKNHYGTANFFLVDPNIIEVLKNANFNVLSIANNHITDHGDEAFWSTVNLLKKNNITPAGIINNIEILEIKGLRIAILAYSYIDDFVLSYLYNKVDSEKKIMEDIKNLRNICDKVIVSIHWGCEYIPFPSLEQIKIGRKLIDCGADVILGHHSHVIQGYELYKEKPIIYGLGNFIFDDVYIKSTRKGIIVKIDIDTNRPIKVEAIPIICDTKEYYPRVADKNNKDEILGDISTIRSLVENKDLSDYYSTIGNYTSLTKKFKKDARMQMIAHFIRNIYKYPPSLTIGIVKDYLIKFFK